MMEILVVAGAIEIILGLLLMWFKTVLSQFLPRRFTNKSLQEFYGQEKSEKIVFYGGLLLLITGLAVFISGLIFF